MAEVVSVIVIGAALAYRAHQLSQQTRMPTLPDIMESPDVTDESVVRVIVVHVRSATIPADRLGSNVKVRVKLGEPGCSVFCDTEVVQVRLPDRSPRASIVAPRLENRPRTAENRQEMRSRKLPVGFGTFCLFAGTTGGESVRLRLIRPGFGGGVLGKAAFKVPRLVNQGTGMENFTLQLKESIGSHSIGFVDVAVEARWVEKGRLSEMLEIMSAERQQQSYSASTDNWVGGEVEENNLGAATSRSLKYGLPVASTTSSGSSGNSNM